MDKNEKFTEQEAPLKNGDNAFVQVGKDGNPLFPVEQGRQSEAEEQEENEGPQR